MRIGIVSSDDVAASALADVARCGPHNDVIWVAAAGAEAEVHCRRNAPDIVLLDMSDAASRGVDSVQRIMAEVPCPILLLTTTGKGNAADVFRALSLGALDVVSLPVLEGGAEDSGAKELLEKIERIARLIGVKPRGRRRTAPATTPLVVIGASTGGPSALSTVLAGLPADLPARVVVIQHIDASFADGLVEWLGETSNLPVMIAQRGKSPQTAHVAVARTNDHLVLGRQGSFEYEREPANLAYRPSIDVFCASVAERGEDPGVAVLLTGLGRDGAAGLLQLRQQGWHTIAQDEATSIVFGMPRVAATMGAAAEILAVDQIASSIARHVARWRAPRR